MKGIGLDSLEIDRMQRVLNRHGEKLVGKIFTKGEWGYSRERTRPAASLAARFAAKEAVIKILGGDWKNLRWCEIEVVSGNDGPALRLAGRTAGLAESKGITGWHISLTHDRERAMAVVVAE